MIQTSLPTLIVFLLAAVLSALALIWAWQVVHHRLRERARNRWRLVCPVCGDVFEDRSRAATLECPACGRKTGRQQVLDL